MSLCNKEVVKQVRKGEIIKAQLILCVEARRGFISLLDILYKVNRK